MRRCRLWSSQCCRSAWGAPSRRRHEAPAKCGFPSGTALIFAGRATTATLGVQAVGDPMSDNLADIYITRDEFDEVERRGRLVCAAYLDPPGFVEITPVPPGRDPLTGRPPQESAGPAASIPGDTTESAAAEPQPTDVTRDVAIRELAPDYGLSVSLVRFVGDALLIVRLLWLARRRTDGEALSPQTAVAA